MTGMALSLNEGLSEVVTLSWHMICKEEPVVYSFAWNEYQWPQSNEFGLEESEIWFKVQIICKEFFLLDLVRGKKLQGHLQILTIHSLQFNIQALRWYSNRIKVKSYVFMWFVSLKALSIAHTRRECIRLQANKNNSLNNECLSPREPSRSKMSVLGVAAL